jgi:hypothetical protein
MAFSQKARGYLSSGVANGPIQMSLEDAVQFLEKATKADPELARDAFVPLAEAAWYCQKLDSRSRGARPMTATNAQPPKDGASRSYMPGQVSLSQFSRGEGRSARTAEAESAWEARRELPCTTAEIYATPADASGRTSSSRAHLNLGHGAGQ